MRETLRRTLERAVIGSGAAAIRRRVGPQRALVLAYHNVVPTGTRPQGDSSLHLPLNRFRMQMDLLQRFFRIVPLSNLLAGDTAKGKTCVAITFDDAYAGAIRHGLGELKARGLPATVFVAPGLLGQPAFWWDRLADPEHGSVPARIRHHALSELGGRQDQVLRWAKIAGHPLAPASDLLRPSTEPEVFAASWLPGIDLGSHTWRHVNMASIPDAEAHDEARKSFLWLKGMSPEGGEGLSYPYGLWSRGAMKAVEQAGFRFAVTAGGGFLRIRHLHRERLFLPRMNVPSRITSEGFLARLSGAWPA